jgi:hypothetical protein
MQKQKQLKSFKDNLKLKFETRTRAAVWQVIKKQKGKVLCNSERGSSRWFDGSKLAFPVA